MADDPFAERCAEFVEALGLAHREDVRGVRRLTGGVASDIGVVDLGGRTICVKFALGKLRVAEGWHAPTRRNAAEYEWLAFADGVVSNCAPRLYGRSAQADGFAMEYLDASEVYLWKEALLNEEPDRGEAIAVADVLGRLHAASADRPGARQRFRNREDFRSLRLDPYLIFTASKHPCVAEALQAMADSLFGSDIALVHGDVSPKNILFRGGEPIFLDAECATTGDPCFDVAFCLNHLVLKAVHLPNSRQALIRAARNFWARYEGHVSWESAEALEARTARLLPALMLARIDGKSPVEYLNEVDRERVRTLSLRLINASSPHLRSVFDPVLEGA